MSNVFGNAANASGQSAQPASSLFGVTGGSNTQASSNLFGNAGATAQSPSSFGNTAASSGGSGLFGNMGATTQNQTSNLFGNNQTTQSNPSTNLFGTAGGPTQPAASNLFGTALSGGGTQSNTNQPQQTQQGSNLFGGGTLGSNQAQSQSQSGLGGGLFGRITGTGASSTATTTTPALGAGLGGGASGAGTTQTTTATLGSGLFGAPGGSSATTQSKPAPLNLGGGLFGRVGAQQTSQPQQTGLGASSLNSSLFAGPTTAAPGQTPAQATTNNIGSTSSAHFQTMLERGKRRQEPAAGAQFGDLPDLQLGLGDIASKVRKLGGNETLSKSRSTINRDLNDFGTHARPRIPPQSVESDTDISAYVAGLHAKRTEEVFKECLEETKRDFDRFVEEHIEINYNEQRQRIYEHFGLAKPRERSDASGTPRGDGLGASFGKSSQKGTSRLGNGSFGSPMGKSVLGGSVNKSIKASLFPDMAAKATSNGFQAVVENPWLRTKEERYAAKVRELNSARLQETTYPIIESFANVELESGGDTPAHVIDAYRALKEIAKETSTGLRPSDPGVVRERQYAQDYLDDNPNSGRSTNMRKRIIEGSRKFLEDSFFVQLEDLIAKNPREASLGGIPTKLNKVRAYVRLRTTRKNLGADVEKLQMLGEDYCWVLIYFLLRSGLVQEAAQFVSDNERAIKSMDRHFSSYISAFAKDPERKLPREMANQMNLQYSQRSKAAEGSIDPFRMACYKIIGRCDVGRRNIEGIQVSMEDWAWLVFSLAREVNRVEEPSAEVFGLQEAREAIDNVGQRHFTNATENTTTYATYFLLLVLAGQFEQAVAWLYPYNYVSAVHFAIALDFYGFLRVSNLEVSEAELLTYTTRGQPQISFARLIGYYTQDFRLARPEAATDYLVLICLNADLPGSAGEVQAQVCTEALKDLVLETREFAQLLGDMQSDGKKIKGAIEQRLPLVKTGADADHATYLDSLTTQAATIADESGRTTDAVLLYHLAEDYDSVITIVNRALSNAIAVPIGQEPHRLQTSKPLQKGRDKNALSITSIDNPADLAQYMMSLYNESGLYLQKIGQGNREACNTLLRLNAAKDMVAARNWGDALDIINSLEILPPLQSEPSNVNVIRSYAQKFNSLPPVVAGNVGPLLLWSIECCGRQREILLNGAFPNKDMASMLANAARNMMVFAGLIRYKLSQDVFEVLARAGQEVINV